MTEGTSAKPCFGFKGPTTLINIPNFDIIEGFVPDPMHMVAGIGKQFANVWFGVKNKSSVLVPIKDIEVINSLMKSIKVPCQIGRLC